MGNLIVKQVTIRTIIGCVLIVLSASLRAQNDEKPLIDLLDSKIYEVPEIFEEPSLDQGDTKAIFYETLSFKGKPTRAFAYIGIPKSDKPVPAMVLVHGGGGKAFYEWVKIWNDRGYAAISMSLVMNLVGLLVLAGSMILNCLWKNNGCIMPYLIL